ncbi:CL16A-like protein [Mya arenaria]|uniref:CL16A-like protein n=1 Tax=Mya arenaria TaxID=6604 RepID=A0ABY7DHF6_MYAAR|nr:CL16A-like protein [Mya arenaria]
MIYISTENRPATVRLSGGRRAVAARSLNRRPAVVVNGLSPARSQDGGSLILSAAALPPNCHLPDILGCHVSREPLKPTAANRRHFVGKMFNKSKGWLPTFSSKPKNAHSLEQLKYLYNVLCKNQTVTEHNRGLLVETLRCISEILIWGDQNDSSVFDFFLEKNMLTFFLRYMRQKYGRFICVQLLQTLNILFENIRNETSLYYLLSNNHINSIIVHKFDFSDEEVMAYYISFLKTLSLKLNKHTIHFFYNEVQLPRCLLYSLINVLKLAIYNLIADPVQFEHTNDFALYTEAIKFFNHSEGMVRIAVRTITLNVYQVKDDAMLRYIRDRTATPYFSNLVWFIGNHILNLDICVRNDSDHRSRGRLATLVAEHLDHLHYINDILLINIDTLNDVLTDQLLNRLLVPLYVYSLTKQRQEVCELCGVPLPPLPSFPDNSAFPLVRQLAEIIFHGEVDTKSDTQTSESPRMLVREFTAPDETLEETLGSSRGLRPRNSSIRIQEGNSTFYRRSGVSGEMATGRITMPYLEALFHALECTENDYEALFALCLLYAMGHNDAQCILTSPLKKVKDNYNVALVERLIRIITYSTQPGSKVRLSTLELCIRLLQQLVTSPDKLFLQDRHLAAIENARECSTQLLRNFYKKRFAFMKNRF